MEKFLDKIQEMTSGEWPNVGLSVALTGEGISHTRGYGFRCLGGNSLIDEDTIFALASCSKTFAVVAILLLKEEGKIDLEDLIIDHLPDFSLSDKMLTSQVTLRDLLCNHLGLMSSEGRHRQTATDRKDLLKRMKDQPFIHKFGAQYAYCTDGFTILGEVIEAASGQKWPHFLQTHICMPLGMDRTNSCHIKAQEGGNFASPHLWNGDGYQSIDWRYEDHVAAPAGGVNSTAKDMLCWLKFLSTGKTPTGDILLSVEVLREAHLPHTADIGAFSDAEISAGMGAYKERITEESYALGWYSHFYENKQILYHTGTIDGFRALIGQIPSLGVGISIFSNADSPYLPRMIFQFFVDHVLGCEDIKWDEVFLEYQTQNFPLKILSSLPDDPLSSEALQIMEPLKGYYHDQTGFGTGVVEEKEGRMILKTGALEFILRPTVKDKFGAYKIWPYCTGPQFEAEIFYTQNGKISHFTTTQSAKFICLTTD